MNNYFRLAAALFVTLLVAGCVSSPEIPRDDPVIPKGTPADTALPAYNASASSLPTTPPVPGGNLTVPTPFNFAPDEINNPGLIARVALTDSSARKMVEAGGEVAGVRMAVKRSARANANDGGVFPALLIRYNGIEADYMVDPVLEKTIGRTVQVPSGAMILEKGNKTSIEYNGSVLFTFDPMEGIA